MSFILELDYHPGIFGTQKSEESNIRLKINYYPRSPHGGGDSSDDPLDRWKDTGVVLCGIDNRDSLRAAQHAFGGGFSAPPKRDYRCSSCLQLGHNKNTCSPKKPERENVTEVKISTEEETAIEKFLKSLPKTPRFVLPSSSHIPTLDFLGCIEKREPILGFFENIRSDKPRWLSCSSPGWLHFYSKTSTTSSSSSSSASSTSSSNLAASLSISSLASSSHSVTMILASTLGPCIKISF